MGNAATVSINVACVAVLKGVDENASMGLVNFVFQDDGLSVLQIFAI